MEEPTSNNQKKNFDEVSIEEAKRIVKEEEEKIKKLTQEVENKIKELNQSIESRANEILIKQNEEIEEYKDLIRVNIRKNLM